MSGPHHVEQRRALWWSLAFNGGFLVAEVVGGVVFGSLALLADGVHMLTDVVGLGVALAAYGLMGRPATARHTYGLQRAEVLGALANGLLLLAASAWIAFEAVGRFGAPEHIDGAGVLVIATAGLAANVASVAFLHRASDRSLNLRGALLHMAADAATSVGVIVAGAVVLASGVEWVDPAMSLVITVVVVWSAWGLLRDTVHVLLEGTPVGLDPAEVQAAIERSDTVEAVHHLHVWNLASDIPALSAHVVLAGEMTLHDAQEHGVDLKAMLAERFGVEHATLELECHECTPPHEPECPPTVTVEDPNPYSARK